MSIMGALIQVKEEGKEQIRTFLETQINVKILGENDKHEMAIVINEPNENIFLQTIESINAQEHIIAFNYTEHYSEDAVQEES